MRERPAKHGSPVLVIAHRGASRRRPDNTLAAFDEALRLGCDAIELDVQLSRDGVPVVFHDKTLSRTGAGRKRVARLDLAELRALDAGGWFDAAYRGEHIPTLKEVLRRYGGRTRLLVEIKTREGVRGRRRHLELARAVAECARETEVSQAMSVLSFNTGVLDELSRVAPKLPRVLNVRPLPALARGLRARLATLDALAVDVRSLTLRYAAQVRDAGCPLFVFTCNTPRRVDLALEAGATEIISDRPGWLGGYLRERNPAP